MKVFTNFTSFTSPIQSPKVPVFDFVAWMHLQVLQVPSKVPNACLWFCSMGLFTIFTSQSKMSQMASLWFCSMSSFTTESKSDGSYYYRIKNLNSTSDFPLQNPYTLGKKGFRGTILYRIKFIPSYHLSPLHNQDLKIWHWGAYFTRKSKTLGCRKPYLYKIRSMTKMWGFVHFLLRVGAPIYRIMDLLRYSPNMSKMDGFCVLASPGFWFCSKVGVQDGSPESKVFGVPTPSIL